MTIRYIFRLIVLALVIIHPNVVHAQSKNRTLLDATGELCDEVKKFLDVRGKNKIRISQVVPDGDEQDRISAIPLLKEAFRRSLLERKVELVSASADYTLLATFKAIENIASNRQAVLLKATLTDTRTGTDHPFLGLIDKKVSKFYYDNLPDVVKTIGINSYAPPGKEPDLQPGVDHPECHFDGTRILAAKGAPFAIEVLVAPEAHGKRKPEDYKEQSPRDEKGLAFVPIKRGEAYGVRIYNLADYEIAVDLRLDGINMYYFSKERDKKGNPAYRYVVLAPKSSVVIRGWFVTLNDSDEFLVVPREKSVFAQLSAGNPAEVGTVTALFHRAWDRKLPRPADEPASSNEHSLSADATGRGQRFQEKFIEVDYAVGTFRGSVCARYTK